MFSRPRSARSRRAAQRGSGVLFALIFASVVAIVLASMLKWVMNEAHMNQRSLLRLEAKNAAEAIAEYGFCQVRYQMENTSTFLANAFTPSGAHPLSLPPTSLFDGTHVSTSTNALTGGTLTSIISTGSTSLYYIDASDPNNTNDPLKGKWVFRRDVPVYARTTVLVPNGPPITAYVQEKISVRGAPLFAHAIFYNMDMELAPGATMNIYGPVHANGDIYVSSQGASVNFYNTVTCTGNIYHAWKSYLATAEGQTNGTTGEALNMTSDVTFKTRTNTQVSMDASGTWKDSTMGVSTTVKTNNGSGTYHSQAEYTAALAAGASANLNAFKTFASSTWNGNVQTSANGVQNYTPVAIGKYVEDGTPSDGTDQSVNTGHLLIEPPTATTSSEYSAEVEAQKYSNQAGIYIQVVPASGYTTTTTTVSGDTVVTTNDPSVSYTITVRTGGPTGTVATSVPANLVKYYPYKETATTHNGTTTYSVNRGLYDQRRGSGQDLVEIDMSALKDAVAQMQLAAGSRDTTKAISSLETAQWTGIVYVEVTSNPTTRLAGTTIAATGGNKVGVRLINGAQAVPSYGTAEGLTIATNAPVYIKGSFNDDGTSPNASTPKTGETPAAIAADAVTLLSASFNDATSRSSTAPSVPSGTQNPVVAAAILTGVAPTNKDGSARMSGGAHNLVRFLENWSSNSKSVYIRGSLVALFESRVAKEPWKIDYYSAPSRNYGFNLLFQNGRYPPGTPRVISYRRADYSDMTKAEYDAALAGL
ncbi:MAG TPA: hypothetical protein VHD62_17765 [Opitutaceae bacterium]|nr:hypothetical protein [Opitutaceae bacterium]